MPLVNGYTITLTFFLSLCTRSLHAQQAQTDRDFTQVDSLAKTVKYHHDIYALTKELTSPYHEDLQKVRAIFIWITDNIAYDYKYINKGKEPKGPKCKEKDDCELVYKKWENDYILRVLKRKKGVCDGYSRLMQRMCEMAGIRCEQVPGYVKTKPYHVGMAGPMDHAWNAVYIDSAWQFLDPTWAAGGCDEDENTGKLRRFHKKYNNYYWIRSFRDLSRDHYPRDAKWVTETFFTKERYVNNPYYAPGVLEDIQLLSPTSGVVQAKKGDTIHFSFDYTGKIGQLQINSNVFRNPDTWHYVGRRVKIPVVDQQALKKQQYIPFKKRGTRYEFSYVVPDNSIYYMDILFDFKRALRFKVQTDN